MKYKENAQEVSCMLVPLRVLKRVLTSDSIKFSG